jgi:hypothetical protein
MAALCFSLMPDSVSSGRHQPWNMGEGSLLWNGFFCSKHPDIHSPSRGTTCMSKHITNKELSSRKARSYLAKPTDRPNPSLTGHSAYHRLQTLQRHEVGTPLASVRPHQRPHLGTVGAYRAIACSHLTDPPIRGASADLLPSVMCDAGKGEVCDSCAIHDLDCS